MRRAVDYPWRREENGNEKGKAKAGKINKKGYISIFLEDPDPSTNDRFATRARTKRAPAALCRTVKRCLKETDVLSDEDESAHKDTRPSSAAESKNPIIAADANPPKPSSPPPPKLELEGCPG